MRQVLHSILGSAVVGLGLVAAPALANGASLVDMREVEQQAVAGESTLAASAGMTYLEIYAVCSENFSPFPFHCERVYDGDTMTGVNHGGSWMRIVTKEMGTRTLGSAFMNGFELRQVSAVPIRNWQWEIIGWYRHWEADGHQEGLFAVHAWAGDNMQWADSLVVR